MDEDDVYYEEDDWYDYALDCGCCVCCGCDCADYDDEDHSMDGEY
ncbi:hypothetical protein SEA_STROSAHL_43 [Gordonia phage Strosahl]|uniref:Uncharacterized protein n=4 Tax=Soupsvirus TaxID=1982562 RepID=A0A160DGF8_9CAUD|nr:hypothetical protein BEN62_gp067 [Gordonia phage KatherineG]YP_009269340.1 hypothetical protein BEN59_gp069 [Gordonia phage Soups]YP_009281654.1 hypothetical protein BIZ67_gp067 [Gordonia phage Remus]YP_009596244.1 hypothetical protein FDH03_gp067 [Gordonia phage Strosahl]ASZ73919.1 hypothetical protein SEA_SHAYRA_43 [Gordonia phage ShayRa]QFP95107.1 hypothetical protein SEA_MINECRAFTSTEVE_43 [Gordonia phage MinecraftSteve]QWS67823.1 hypothetical protein SEA_DEKHOCKEY33_42 [Gordonia phage 